MRHNQRLTYETLRDETAKAVAESDMLKQDLAETLKKTPAAIGQAIRLTGAKYSRLQGEIINFLTDYHVEEEQADVTFRARKK